MPIPLPEILIMTVSLFLQLLQFLILIRVFMSWLAPGTGGQFAAFLHSSTEPVLGFFRALPLRIGMIDLSPIVAIFAIDFARMIIVHLIATLFA